MFEIIMNCKLYTSCLTTTHACTHARTHIPTHTHIHIHIHALHLHAHKHEYSDKPSTLVHIGLDNKCYSVVDSPVVTNTENRYQNNMQQ